MKKLQISIYLNLNYPNNSQTEMITSKNIHAAARNITQGLIHLRVRHQMTKLTLGQYI